MFTILLSVLFATNIFAAPLQPNTTTSWGNLKNDKSLISFQSTLLNQTLLTFLDDCYLPENLTKENILCVRYLDAILQLNETNYVVSKPEVEKLYNDFSKETDVCGHNYTFPADKYFSTASKNLSNPPICGYLCLQKKGYEFVPKPICAFLAWLGKEIVNSSKLTKPSAIQEKVVIPSVSNVVSDNKTFLIREQEKPDNPALNVAKPAAPPVIQDALNTHPNSSIPAAAKVEQSHSSSIVPPKSDLLDHKEIPTDLVAAHVPEAPAPAAPNKDTIKPPPIDVSQEDVIPTSNAQNTQQEESPPQDLPVKPESIPNEDLPIDNDSEVDPNEDINQEDGDDDADDFEVSQQKLPKDSPVAAIPDENEVDQKSQEHNYLPNTNHVTDPFLEESGSNFFTYFLVGMFLCIILYVGYHNKSKILALLLEGRRGDKGRSGRRKHTAAYRKLDSNLEEAITSSASGRTTQIIY